MKLKLLLAGVLFTIVITGGMQKASAQEKQEYILPFPLSQSSELFVKNSFAPMKLEVSQLEPKEETKTEPEVPKVPEPVEYVVVSGDYLDKIATANNIAWKRLWDKNLNITNPDIINVGDKLIIPREDEVLADRALPAAPVIVSGPVTQKSSGSNQVMVRGSVSGNLYTPGYCTWYVKNRRPDLPNNLGNADTWYSRATAQGLPTGTTPRAGAAAQTKGQMHVVYVESVNSDGTIVISEMNYSGLYSQRTVTVPASNYYYIY